MLKKQGNQHKKPCEKPASLTKIQSFKKIEMLQVKIKNKGAKAPKCRAGKTYAVSSFTTRQL